MHDLRDIEPPTGDTLRCDSSSYPARSPSGTSGVLRAGDYRLLERIGEGGYGVVWRAEQVRPLRRQVAIKILKPGTASPSTFARFAAEQRALARMQHASIAKVHDSGTGDDGTPWFVMELIHGMPITDYARVRSLSLEKKLRLFADVCSAVHHAHEKGVIHRDLKPSNILVQEEGGKPVPKVIDFGIAKVLESEDGMQPPKTEARHLVGTPHYMSPEHFDPDCHGVDTRSDVYSLGVLLYELLTGTTPFAPDEVRPITWSQLERLVREVEPEKPSGRMRRSLSRAERSLPGELDWITLKCLEKDRSRRYASAAALASDITAYLENAPIMAGAPGSGYRLRRFARRHRGAVMVLVMFLVLGAAGTTVASLGWHEARRERDLAMAEGDRARRAADEALAAGTRSRRVLDFLEDMIRSASAEGGDGPALPLAAVLEATARRLDHGTISNEATDEAEIRALLGGTYRTLGLLDEADRQLDAARKLIERSGREETKLLAEVTLESGQVLLARGRPKDARPLFEWVHEVVSRVDGGSSNLAIEALRHVGIARQLEGAAETARMIFEQALSTLARANAGDSHLAARIIQNLAEWHRSKGDSIGALRHLERASEIQRRLDGASGCAAADLMTDIGRIHFERGASEEALTAFTAALAAKRSEGKSTSLRLAPFANNVGAALFSLGRLDEAIPYFSDAIRIYRLHLGTDHPELARALANFALVCRESSRIDQALSAAEEAVAIERRLAPRDDGALANALGILAGALTDHDHLERAEAVASEALGLFDGLPDERAFGRLEALQTMAVIDARLGRHAAAADRLRGVVSALASGERCDGTRLRQVRAAHAAEELRAGNVDAAEDEFLAIGELRVTEAELEFSSGRRALSDLVFLCERLGFTRESEALRSRLSER